MSNSPFRNVTIVGATGQVGYPIADAALNDGSYKVKILRKKPENENEKSKLLASKGAEVVFADYNQKDDLVKALKGTDVLISAIGGGNFSAIQSLLLAAAKEVGVKRFVPSEFGGDYSLGDHAFTDDKFKFREELEKSGLEYTYIYTGLFQEYFNIFFDAKNKKAFFYADGSKKLSITSLPDIGKYTVETLRLPEARNAYIRVAGATLSFNEFLQLFEKASGSKWEVVEDKNVRQRFRDKIDPVPSFFDDFKAFIAENGELINLDNDKFSFTPRPITEVIDAIVTQE